MSANPTIRLGHVDTGCVPDDIPAFLKTYHSSMNYKQIPEGRTQFRAEGTGCWYPFEECSGQFIRQLQQFLYESGFMPRSNRDGIFGYATNAATRIFQEYVRTIEGDITIGTPDGVVGAKTWAAIERWQSQSRKSSWLDYEDRPSEEYLSWLNLIKASKAYLEKHPGNRIQKEIEEFTQASATLKLKDWNTSPKAIHLIGIRRNEDKAKRTSVNDDLFILLLKGMVFKFWGSTDADPNPKHYQTKPMPFLSLGQHRYRFAWHKIGSKEKVYRALRPDVQGVLVYRDEGWDELKKERVGPDYQFDYGDIRRGLDPAPNHTINIHWSGIGRSNFSAGCQVIAGESYINHLNEYIDCGAFAASSYSELANEKTRGAYNVLIDLIFSYALQGVTRMYYTLVREVALERLNYADAAQIKQLLQKLKGKHG